DLDHIERSSRGDLLTRVADAAGFRGRAVNAVQRLRQNSCGSGFSHAARAGKNVCVRHAIVANRVLQRFRDVPLADKIPERLRTPLACDDLVAHKKLSALSIQSSVKKYAEHSKDESLE